MLTAPNGKRQYLVVKILNISLRGLDVSRSKWTRIICACACNDFREILCIYGLWLFAGKFQEIIAKLCAMQWSAKTDNKLDGINSCRTNPLLIGILECFGAYLYVDTFFSY